MKELITDCRIIISGVKSDESIPAASFNKLDGGMSKLFLLS